MSWSIGHFYRLGLLFLLFHSLLIQNALGVRSEQFEFDYEATEPYDELNGFEIVEDIHVPESPDPLVSYRWNPNVDDTKLQYYRVRKPVSYQAVPKDCAVVHNDGSKSSSFQISVHQNCTVRFDWGVERAAWMELISLSNLSGVQASLSEFNMEYPGKTKPLTKYGNHTYRLETNKELYEGIRFTWLYFKFRNNIQDGIVVRDVSLVAKVKPVNYTGSFFSSDTTLTRAWYTGAYGVRLNMQEHNFNSILVERGDRVAIQGDGHPTIAASLVAFSPYALVKNVLLQTDSGDHSVVDQGIMAYPLYWCLSVLDYYMESGDTDTFTRLAKDVMKILDARIDDFLAPDLDMQWFGWDDRLGNGWCFHSNGDKCPEEAHLALAVLIVRVCRDFAKTLEFANMKKDSQRYHDIYGQLGKKLRSISQWPNGFGVHAAANAINSGIASRKEIDSFMTSILNDPVNLCSVSQFNQYWILQSYGNAGYMEQALASIKLCWKAPLELGKGCFWENSSPEWLAFLKQGDAAPGLPSYCHPWASGVTEWLSHQVGGIRPLLPGYKEVLVAPYLSKEYPSVKASILTPRGLVRLNASLVENREKRFTIRVSLYSPVDGFFGFRSELLGTSGKANAKLRVIKCDEELVEPMTKQDVLGGIPLPAYDASSISLPDHRLFAPLKAGVHTNFTILYDSLASEKQQDIDQSSVLQPFPDPVYPATVLGIDRLSRGNGLSNYGADGYVLVGHNHGEDVVRIPSYIRNVSIWHHGYPGWVVPQREFAGTSLDDPTFLVDEKASNGTGTRNLGMVGYDDSRGGQINELFLHIETSPTFKSSAYVLSVYFVAKSKESKHAIRTMNLVTLNVVAQTTLIQNYTTGVWWTVEYNDSVRLRLSDIKGMRVSAIAFSRPNQFKIPKEDYMSKR